MQPYLKSLGAWLSLLSYSGLAIYEIKEVWEGPDKLQQANYALRALPKGLKSLRAIPPLDSPQSYGTDRYT